MERQTCGTQNAVPSGVWVRIPPPAPSRRPSPDSPLPASFCEAGYVRDPDPWAFIEPSSKRLHRRLFRLNERLVELGEEAAQIAAELEYHRAINEDAQADARVGNYIDREEAGLTAADVRRFERALGGVESKIAKLEERRSRLLARLPR